MEKTMLKSISRALGSAALMGQTQFKATVLGTGSFTSFVETSPSNDMDQTKKVYRNVLGFKVEGETAFTADAAMRSLEGLAKAEVRRSRVQAPGSMLWIEFVEFKGVNRTPLRMRIQDQGAARLQLRVQDTDAIVAAMKAAGFKVMSTEGVVQLIPPNFKAALVADPNNFFLTPYAPCDGCAPGLEPVRSAK
jgi:catechol 2,3-dioxygenase-like lactoylglutathione lyase family enzyme